MENHEKKYKKALEKLQEALAPCEDGCKISGLTRDCLENIFPELQENEDERIKKELCKAIWTYIPYEDAQKYITWLEKQGQKPKKVSIWKHWKDGIAGNSEGRQVYLIRVDNTYNLSSVLDFECDYIELSELDNLMLEKQGENKPTENVEIKFCEGDKVVSNQDGKVYTVGTAYYITGDNICLHDADGNHLWTNRDDLNKNYHLWASEDIKTLYADKVIAWLNENVADFWANPCNPQNVINQFKKDFGL